MSGSCPLVGVPNRRDRAVAVGRRRHRVSSVVHAAVGNRQVVGNTVAQSSFMLTTTQASRSATVVIGSASSNDTALLS